MGQTIAQKILARASGKEKVQPGEIVWVTPDRILMYAWWGLTDHFARVVNDELGLETIRNPEKCTMFIDHMTPPASAREADFINFAREFAAKNRIALIEREGIGHQVVIDQGLVNPGDLVAHFDQHVQGIGAVGALAFTLLLDMLTPLALGRFWVEVPKSLRVDFKGFPGRAVTSRDILHYLMTELGEMGALNMVVEMGGEGAGQIGIDGRMTLCGMLTFVGAVSAVFCPDERVERHYKEIFPDRQTALIKPDENATYEKHLEIDLARIEPQVAPPPNPLPSGPVAVYAGLKVHQGYIGSCAGGRLEDLQIAAEVLKGRKIRRGFRLNIVPSSRKIMLEAERLGLLRIFLEAGASVSFPSCDFCYGRMQALGKGDRALSTGTMNVPGRMGSTEAQIYMAGPATIASSAITGEITDPRTFIS